MQDLTVYDYSKKMDEDNIILTFKGMISQEILADVGINLRTKFSEYNISKKTFAIFVELAQNIYHHSAQKDFSSAKGRPAGIGVLIVQNFDNYLIFSSGNMVETSKAKALVERCEYINSLSEDELRDFYKKQRKKPQGGIGANIGLIDMARRSGHPLGYDMEEIDGNISFFSLAIKISKED